MVKIISDELRMDFLPRHMGIFQFSFEGLLYAFARKLCADYDGAYWDFYEEYEGEGFFFCAPRMSEKYVTARWEDNYSEEEVSTQALGIVATLFALNYMAQSGEERAIQKYYALLDYVPTHPEARAIYSLID